MATPKKKLPRWLDRASFEADKLMRANRVRAEASKLAQNADERTHALALKVLEIAGAGTELPEDIVVLVKEINGLQSAVAKKEEEFKKISAEIWTEPAPPPPPPPRPDSVAQRLQAYVDTMAPGTFNCPKCGTVIRANAAFCPRCGRKIIR